MSLNDGLEYINTTKSRMKTRLQGKGVDVSEETPYRSYPDLIESELINKSWQYPTNWFQLTPKAEFPNHTLEAVLFDVGYDFCFYSGGSGNCRLTIYGGDSGGIYTLNGEVYNLNEAYDISTGYLTIRLNKNTGNSDFGLYTTFKLVITYDEVLTTFYPRYTESTQYITYSPILAFRIKDNSNNVKNVFFGSQTSGTAKRVEAKFLQYCDLSMLNGLSVVPYKFNNCRELVKVELPQGTVLPNFYFNSCTNLREIIGADFTDTYNRVGVFYGCNSFKPPAFNYIGESNYYQVNLASKVWKLPHLEEYPKNFIQSKSGVQFNDEDIYGNLYKIIIPDTVTKFPHNAFNGMTVNSIIHLPSCEATITTEPTNASPVTVDAFIHNPYLIENGENFYLDTPVGVQISNVNGSEQLYIPHIPLRWLNAGCSSTVKGNLKSIIFDGARSNFDEALGENAPYAIRIDNQAFTRETIIELFNQLPTVVTSRVINVTGNPGASELTEEDLNIAVNKNWIVTK